MKNVFGKKLKIACAGFLAACACVTAGICFSDNGNPTQANAEFVEAPVFQTVYDLNSTISIPSASLSYGSAQYPATAYLISPDGTVYSLNECTLDTAGKWQVMYKAQTDSGEIVSETLSFEVYSQIVSVGDKSTMEYTTFSNTHYSYEGYRIELAKGESIDYNRIIDLNEVTSKDDLFSLFVIPKNLGSADATRLIVTFTDIYDPENVVSVMLQQTLVDTTTWSYVTAKAPGQSYSGLYNQPRTGFDTVSIDGVDVGLFSGSIYGTQLAFSFVGNVHKYTGNGRRYYGEVGDQLFSLSWDYSQRRVYLPWHHTSQKVICDLDESYMKVDWDGFTTGEVMMSISADGYLSDTICLFVEDMNGENLSNNRFQDAKAPEIKLDFGAFDRDSLPVAVVGEKYPLFPAVAFDDYSGYLSYQTRVYYNYHNNMRVE
ncbi:MAG: hypothetical protein IJX98_01245, partial [Clostridia bacterium]|nr:hypothetical protein [Clostridia bacterium]